MPASMSRRTVFVTGGTGYLGRPLIERLVARGHAVRALVRPRSVGRLPDGAEPVVGDALDARTFADDVAPADTLVHLVGTPHPSPSKAAEFRAVDLASLVASVEAARRARVRHVVYVSVAQPAPVMRAYVDVRMEGERRLRESGIPTTVLRPWYVLGPGHRWPLALVPAYWVMARIPSLRDGARRLGLVTHAQMVAALVDAVERPADGTRVLDVAAIRRVTSSPPPPDDRRRAGASPATRRSRPAAPRTGRA